ncbi:MAG: 3-hydroxy-5-phosphonooxypentane-2,4-dione thiolase [Kiritimatiellae bacterium]|nr:3-hydroxy-5-phosphonooxypentane-2,4-dione thiolase [Kiritimatiellia bacterium]MDD5520284.1 3-hydroxy-5-phosphonooxypentane-2,4-dione thiolase [Kiritimatiellia bacterium]
MAEATGNQESKDYGIGIPAVNTVYKLKGSNNYDWGMKDRLSRVFSPKSGKTVMLAFDHGYIMGPTSGLERIDITILPLLEYADCLMCTRGVLRACVPPTYNKAISLRCSAGSTVLTELNDECVGVEIEDAIRLNASMMAVMVAIGSKFEALTVRNLCKMIETGNRYGIPTLGVTAVGKELTRDARYLGLATRVLAENGAQVIKTYYCEENFEQVTAGCPVPIVIAGGKKLPELDALKMAYMAVDQGALGVDMGRNIFQAEHPVAMIQAVKAVVHEGVNPEKAFKLYNELKAEKKTKK